MTTPLAPPQPAAASARLPVLFVGHGSPMNTLEKNAWHLNWQDMGVQLRAQHPHLRAILCISAHWLTQGNWWLTGMQTPRTLHDFRGFPRELFAQHYPAPGAPAIAQQLAQQLRAPTTGEPLQVDLQEWGLDHGAWSVLQVMFPQADIPVLQLSMDATRSSAEHFALGQQLHALREQGILIIASGNIVHNLAHMRLGTGLNATYPWAQEFDTRVAQHLAQGQPQACIAFAQWGEISSLSHPTPEHFWPLLYASAAAGPQERPQFFNTGFQAASISMRSAVWGL